MEDVVEARAAVERKETVKEIVIRDERRMAPGVLARAQGYS